MRLRLAFMGTPEFAVPTLAGLIEAGHDVVAVYTRPSRAAGRGHREQPTPVADYAAGQGLPVQSPASLREPPAQAEFAALGVDAAVVVAYGLLLPKPFLEAPRLGCINLHASLLPRWRGAAPIQRAIQAGDRETGVTVMLMEEGLDTGPILAAERVTIAPDETGGGLTAKLAEIGGRFLPQVLADFACGQLQPRPQPAEGITHAAKLTRAEARLDWRKPAAVLEREVRAFNPSPASWFVCGDERIKVLRATVAQGGGKPGIVTGPGLTVPCGSGALRLVEVQRPGRRAMSDDELLRGFAIPPGTVLPA
jgi:methionyl-tRNA formyltransferase